MINPGFLPKGAFWAMAQGEGSKHSGYPKLTRESLEYGKAELAYCVEHMGYFPEDGATPKKTSINHDPTPPQLWICCWILCTGDQSEFPRK